MFLNYCSWLNFRLTKSCKSSDMIWFLLELLVILNSTLNKFTLLLLHRLQSISRLNIWFCQAWLKTSSRFHSLYVMKRVFKYFTHISLFKLKLCSLESRSSKHNPLLRNRTRRIIIRTPRVTHKQISRVDFFSSWEENLTEFH